MRKSYWTPSIMLTDYETVYLVADDFVRLGRAWREADCEATDLETVSVGQRDVVQRCGRRVVSPVRSADARSTGFAFRFVECNEAPDQRQLKLRLNRLALLDAAFFPHA